MRPFWAARRSGVVFFMNHAFPAPEARKKPAEEHRRERFSGLKCDSNLAGFRSSPAGRHIWRDDVTKRVTRKIFLWREPSRWSFLGCRT